MCRLQPTSSSEQTARPSLSSLTGALDCLLTPDTVNTLMTLKHSRSLWSSDMTIQEILDSNDFRDPEEESDSEEEEEDDDHDA